MQPRTRDKLIVSLLMGDVIDDMNQAMKVRRIEMVVDYTSKKRIPALLLRAPDMPAETWLTVDTRKKLTFRHPLQHPHLCQFVQDADDRFQKLGCMLFLVGHRSFHGHPTTKLQVCVDGSKSTALTLITVPQGMRSQTLTHFIPPSYAA